MYVFINPLFVNAFTKSITMGRKTKTDSKDAYTISLFAKRNSSTL